MAGGSGRRMGDALPKQFLMLHNRPVLAHTIDRMHEALPGGTHRRGAARGAYTAVGATSRHASTSHATR